MNRTDQVIYDYSGYPRLAELLALARESGRAEHQTWGGLTPPDHPSKSAALVEMETTLQEIDEGNWQRFSEKAGTTFALPASAERGWERMTDMLSEATAYSVLKRHYGVPDFVPEAKKQKRPDLKVEVADGSLLICEVKTLNVSDFSIRNRGVAFRSPMPLDHSFYRRLADAIERGLPQLDGFETDRNPRKMLFVYINFDDSLWWEHREYYAGQLDAWLAANPQTDIETNMYLPSPNRC